MSDFKTKFASGYYTEPPPGPDLPPMPLVSWADNESPTDEQWRTFCEARKSWYSRTLPARREHNRQTRAQLAEREREFIHDLAEHIDLPQGEALVRAILAAATEGNPLNRFISTADESDRLVFVTELAEHLAQAVKGAG